MQSQTLSSRWVAGVLAISLAVVAAAAFPAKARAEQYQSRLGNLLLKKSSFYMPGRLVLGQENRFTVKAPPGSQVQVFLSPAGEGKLFADRIPLAVGEDAETLNGTVPETGVLELTLPLPAEDAWEGKVLYVDAVVGKAEDYSDYSRPELVDATGRKAVTNALVLAKPAEKNQMMVLPAIPGVDTRMFNQITTLTDIYASDDPRKKQLLMDGSINRDAQIDKSTLMQRTLFSDPSR